MQRLAIYPHVKKTSVSVNCHLQHNIQSCVRRASDIGIHATRTAGQQGGISSASVPPQPLGTQSLHCCYDCLRVVGRRGQIAPSGTPVALKKAKSYDYLQNNTLVELSGVVCPFGGWACTKKPYLAAFGTIRYKPHTKTTFLPQKNNLLATNQMCCSFEAS